MKRNTTLSKGIILTMLLLAGCSSHIAAERDGADSEPGEQDSITIWSSEDYTYAAAEAAETGQLRTATPETAQQCAERIEYEDQYKKNSNLFDVHLSEIRAEIESHGDHQWAGVYYRGDGLGTNAYLHIAPHAGIAFSNQGCIGRPELNYGFIRSEGGLIRADWQFNDKHASDRLADQYLAVHWGGRSYLIPPEQIFQFCGSVATKHEPRDEVHRFFLLREGDEEKSVLGIPHLPAGFEKYLNLESIEGRVVAVTAPEKQPPDSIENRVHYQQTVTIDMGAADGVLNRMGFELKHPGESHITANVQTVRKNESDLLLNHYVFDGAHFQPASVTWVFINEDFFRR